IFPDLTFSAFGPIEITYRCCGVVCAKAGSPSVKPRTTADTMEQIRVLLSCVTRFRRYAARGMPTNQCTSAPCKTVRFIWTVVVSDLRETFHACAALNRH